MPATRFANRSVIVTGGSAGIGFGIARRFLKMGAQVAILARNPDRGKAAAAELSQHGPCRFIATDVTKEDQITTAIDQVVQAFGGLDVLVNNAGCGVYRSTITPEDGPADRWEFYRRANLDSAYLMAAHALPHLARRDGAMARRSSTFRPPPPTMAIEGFIASPRPVSKG